MVQPVFISGPFGLGVQAPSGWVNIFGSVVASLPVLLRGS